MRYIALATLFIGAAAPAADRGEEVYNTICKACHGELGGKPVIPQARDLKTAPFKNPKGATVEGVLEVLQNGLPGTLMMPQAHVPIADRQAVAKWLIAQRPAPAAADAPSGEAAVPADTPATPPAAEGDKAAAPADGGETAEPSPPAAAPAASAKTEVAAQKTISIQAAMQLELQRSVDGGLTVYHGWKGILPGLTSLGLPRKLPDPVMPGKDDTYVEPEQGEAAEVK